MIGRAASTGSAMVEYQGSFASSSAATGPGLLIVTILLFGTLPGALACFLLPRSRVVQNSCHCLAQPPWARSKVRLAWVPDLRGTFSPGKLRGELRVGFMKVCHMCNCHPPAERMANDC